MYITSIARSTLSFCISISGGSSTKSLIDTTGRCESLFSPFWVATSFPTTSFAMFSSSKETGWFFTIIFVIDLRDHYTSGR